MYRGAENQENINYCYCIPGGRGAGGGTGGPPGLPSAPKLEVGPLNGLPLLFCGCGTTVEVNNAGFLPFCKLDSGKSCSAVLLG